jgi:hypothetical protein
MAEPQKVSACKYCGQEITWNQDPVSGKNYPKNLNGSPHLCKKEAAPAQGRAPVTDIAGDAVEKAKERMAKAGFGQPTGGNTTDCTSPDTPTLKTVEGQIVVLDVPAHKVVLKTKDGQQHGFVWPPALNDQMSRLKQWYFARLTGEHQKDVDIWKLTAQEFFKRPEDWPATVHSRVFGGQPRNDKAIILQTCLKVAADVRIARGFCDSDDGVYADQMAEITAEAIKAADALCKAGGVQ